MARLVGLVAGRGAANTRDLLGRTPLLLALIHRAPTPLVAALLGSFYNIDRF